MVKVFKETYWCFLRLLFETRCILSLVVVDQRTSLWKLQPMNTFYFFTPFVTTQKTNDIVSSPKQINLLLDDNTFWFRIISRRIVRAKKQVKTMSLSCVQKLWQSFVFSTIPDFRDLIQTNCLAWFIWTRHLLLDLNDSSLLLYLQHPLKANDTRLWVFLNLQSSLVSTKHDLCLGIW